MNTLVAPAANAEVLTTLPPNVPLSQFISIGAGFSRSINLERDQDATELLQGYVPTSRALVALEQIADGLDGHAAGRALALIGPYGAGKSAFALFAGALLGPPTSPAKGIAEAKLHEAAPGLAKRLTGATDNSQGLLRVQVNGIPDSLIRQVMLALARAATRAELPTTLIKRIEAAARPGNRMDHVIDLVEQVKGAWVEKGGRGLLIELDELGKFLEHEGQGAGQSEIHLLQLLAEKAVEPRDSPLCLLVMLHQAFEHYSGRLGKSLRDEWKKVQGRFSAVAFLEPAEQSLRVAAAAFNRGADLDADLKGEIFNIASRLTECSALPLGLDLSAASELFETCYPLHPATLLSLPVLCQRVAQNERTLFSYLASTEHFGLGRRLDELRPGDWVGPWELYDYFILNQAGGFSDPLTYHRWVEVITALERYDGDTESGSDDPTVRLLKTIGLLNLVGAQRGLKASDGVLRLIFGDELDGLLERLLTASIIHFRGYAQEYRVWQGSDFDLHAALEQATAEQSGRVFTDTLNELNPLPPVVARRASIESGTLRSFQVRFASTERWPPKPADAELDLFLYLAEPGERPELSDTPEHAVVAVCRSTERLSELVTEWQALKELPKQHAQLQQDPVAKREHEAWLENAETDAIGAIRSLLESPEQLRWHFGGEYRRISNRRMLQGELSAWVTNRCFPLAPIIRNELINRERPSAAASTGRKKLLAAMLTAADHDGLGIAKTPAEKSLYLSLLRQSRLHRAGKDGRWDFYPPEPAWDPCHVAPAWRAIHKALGDAGQRQVPLPELFATLQAAPYGIRLGVLPILIITYLLAHRRELALYQEGAFCEDLTIERAELLCRRPNLFAIERFALHGLRGELFDRYLGSIVGRVRADATLLDIARPLVRFAADLPEYSQHCSGLSAEAERVRAAFRQAKSPGLLLFDALPRACGTEPDALDGDGLAPAPVEAFISRLVAVLRELNGAYPALLQGWQARLNEHLLDIPVPDLPALRRRLVERYGGLERLAPRQGGVGAFCRRLAADHFDTDQAWLESVLTLLGNAPPAKWRESHRVHAELRVQELADQLRELELLRQAVPEARTDVINGERPVLLRLVEGAGDEISRVVHLSREQRRAAETNAARIVGDLADLDEATRVAVVADLLRRITATPNDGEPSDD